MGSCLGCETDRLPDAVDLPAHVQAGLHAEQQTVTKYRRAGLLCCPCTLGLSLLPFARRREQLHRRVEKVRREAGLASAADAEVALTSPASPEPPTSPDDKSPLV